MRQVDKSMLSPEIVAKAGAMSRSSFFFAESILYAADKARLTDKELADAIKLLAEGVRVAETLGIHTDDKPVEDGSFRLTRDVR